MAYIDQEASIESGAPYFLYEFNSSIGDFLYTDYPTTITWNSQDWLPFPIKHGQVKQSKALSKNGISITIPIQGSFANLFVGWSPDLVVSVTVRRGHFGSSDTLVYWKGRIASHLLKDKAIELQCESIFTSLRRPGLRGRYQRSCRHALYSPGCNLDKSNFVVSGTVSAISGNVLTISAAAGEADGWFNGGVVEFADGSFRTIVVHTGSSVTINRTSRFIQEYLGGYGYSYGYHYGAVSALLYPGCDRTLTTCKSKFNNLVNNGGFKWIPSKNPMSGSSIA